MDFVPQIWGVGGGVFMVYSRTDPYLDEHPDLEPLPGLSQQIGTESSLAAVQGQFL